MKRVILIVIPILILGSLIVWRLGQKHAEAVGQSKMREIRMKAPVLVETAAAARRDIVHTFSATGTVESPQNVKIAAKITGRIEYLNVREGDRVRKGQVLVRIDPDQVEADVHAAMANLAEAQYRLAQGQITQNSTDVGVNSQIRQQKAAVDSAKADYEQVQQNYIAQVAAADAAVRDANAKVENANASIKSAKANLTNANAKLNRILDLYKQGFIAAQEVDDAKAAVEVQKSALEIAQAQLVSATAQKESAQHAASIVKTKGTADIEAAKARLEQARASYAYASANTAQKSAYKQSIAALKANVEAARAALRSAQAKRADTILISPLDGYVTGRYVDPGAVTTPGQAILSVQFVKQVWVTISVPEEIGPLVHIGMPATVRCDAYPGRKFSANVVQFNPSADLQSRQFMVRVILSNDQGLFKPGMFGRVSLETERIKDALCVPKEAVRRGPDGPTVTVVEAGNKARLVRVATGASDDHYTAIAQGLEPGQKVVILSAFPVKDGATLTIGGEGGRGAPGGPGGRPGQGERGKAKS